MASTNNIDDLRHLLNDVLQTASYTQKRTNDGSHLRTNEVEKSFQEILKIFDENLKNTVEHYYEKSKALSEKINEWDKEGGAAKYRQNRVRDYRNEQIATYQKLGFTKKEATDKTNVLVKSYANKIKQEQNKVLQQYKDINSLLEKEKFNQKINANTARYQLHKQNTYDAWNSVTNGRTAQVAHMNDQIKSFGAGLEYLGGGKGGGFIAKVGRNIQANAIKNEKFVGKLSFATMAAEQFGQMVVDTINFVNKQLKLTAQQSMVNFEFLSGKTALIGEKVNAELEYNTQIFQKQAEGGITYISSLAKAELQRYTGAVDSKITSFTDITGGAYKALDTEISYKYAQQKAEIERIFAIGNGPNSELGILIEKAGVKLAEQTNVFDKQEDLLKIQNERKTEQIKNAKIGEVAGAVGGVATAAGAAIISGGNPIAAGLGYQIGSGASKAAFDLYAANQDFYYQQQEIGQSLELQHQKIYQGFMQQSQDSISSIKSMALNAVKDIATTALNAKEAEEKAWANLSAEVDKKWEVAENASNEIGISFGYLGSQMDEFKTKMFNTQVSVSKWGKKMEDVQQIQENYSIETGRNIQLTNEDFNSQFAMGTFWGDDTMATLNSEMEYFNHSVKDSNEMFYEMHKSVLKMGLNAKKYGKDLVNNLKLAEKYNFKNGVKGLMDMAKWAQNMRFNTASLDGMLDKVQEGGLEGIIQQAAGLQVLGGNFAMGSDPLAMAYESYMDPEGYAKRMNAMLAGQGYLKEDGSVGFGITSQQIMRQYAKLNGIDYKDVLKQATQQYKISAIQSSLNPSQNFNEDQQAMIANKAQFVDGQWKVNTGLEDAQGNSILKNVNEITPEDLKLMIDDSEKTLEDAALESLSVQRNQEAVQQYIQSDLMNNYEDFKTEHLERMDTVFEDYIKNQDGYRKKVYGYVDAATTSLGTIAMYYNNVTPQDIADKFSSSINTTLAEITQNLKLILEAIGEKYDIIGEELESVGGNHNLLQVKKMMDSNGGFDKAVTKLDNDADFDWYSAEMKTAMDALREDPSSLLKVKDKELQTQLARLIFIWNDEGFTTDFDYHNSQELADLMKTALNGDAGITYNNKRFRYNSTIPGGGIRRLNDGVVYQNGNITKIDNQDQVLTAKNGGPIDKMLDLAQNSSNVIPRPMSYNSFVSSSVGGMSSGMGSNNSINIPPIQININGSIQLNGSGGSIDITQQLSNDPNFIRSISQIISVEVEKKVNGGKTINTLNRNLIW